MKIFARTLLVSLFTCILYACGGGGGGDSGAGSAGSGGSPNTSQTGGNAATVLVGVFLDSAVSNIKYRTTTPTGTISKEGNTDSLGQFNYLVGDTITFSVGGISLPSALAAKTITPMDLANTKDMGSNTVLNILVFLQSLDDDGNPSNGVNIPNAANAAATTAIDFSVLPAVFRSNPVFNTLVANSGSTNRTPVSLSSAMDHFKTTLVAGNIVVQDPRPVAVIKAIDPVMVGKTVTLDGTSSTDPKSSSLNYNWILTAPKDSKAKLSNATGAKPKFSIDISGEYVLNLTVDNGTLTGVSTLTVKGIDNIFGNSNLHLYGKVPSNNQNVVYLGCLTCDASQADSVCSGDSQSNYGLTNSAHSIWDVNQNYGDPASLYSPMKLLSRKKRL